MNPATTFFPPAQLGDQLFCIEHTISFCCPQIKISSCNYLKKGLLRKIPEETISRSKGGKIYATPVLWTAKSCPWQPPVDFITLLPSVLWPIFTHLSDPQSQDSTSRDAKNAVVSLLGLHPIDFWKRHSWCLGHKDNFMAPVLVLKEWRCLIWVGGKKGMITSQLSRDEEGLVSERQC